MDKLWSLPFFKGKAQSTCLYSESNYKIVSVKWVYKECGMRIEETGKFSPQNASKCIKPKKGGTFEFCPVQSTGVPEFDWL